MSAERNGSYEAMENDILALIRIPRVVITEETADYYMVEFDGETYCFAKSDESSFQMGGGGSSGGGSLRMTQEIKTITGTFLTHDENIPAEFAEVIMLHELREEEYVSCGLEDAHDRAVNDEFLYVQKYFSPDAQKRYFAFARDYRHNAVRKEALRLQKEAEAAHLDEQEREKVVQQIPVTAIRIKQQQAVQLIAKGLQRIPSSDDTDMIFCFPGHPTVRIKIAEPKINVEKKGRGKWELVEDHYTDQLVLVLPLELAMHYQNFLHKEIGGQHMSTREEGVHIHFFHFMLDECVRGCEEIFEENE